MREEDLKAHEHRIDELIAELIWCAADGEVSVRRVSKVGAARDALQEAIAEYRGAPNAELVDAVEVLARAEAGGNPQRRSDSMTDIQAAERRIDELVDDLIEAARAVEMHDYAPGGTWRTVRFGAAQADLQGVRDQLQEAIAEYVEAALRAAEQPTPLLDAEAAYGEWMSTEAHRQLPTPKAVFLAAFRAALRAAEQDAARLRDVARRLVEIDERTTEGGYRYIEDSRFYSDLRAGAAAAREALNAARKEGEVVTLVPDPIVEGHREVGDE
jgi:hypothetical protein